MTNIWLRVEHATDAGLPWLIENRWLACPTGDQPVDDAIRNMQAQPWVGAVLTEDEYDLAVRGMELATADHLRKLTTAELGVEAEHRFRSAVELRLACVDARVHCWVLEQLTAEDDRDTLARIDAELMRRRMVEAASAESWTRKRWSITADFVSDLKRRVALHEFIAHEMPGIGLRRAGAVYQAKCPFHADDTPSFTVYTDEGRFICFGCSIHGDVFDFAMTMPMGCHEWRDAVEYVAAYAGVALPAAEHAVGPAPIWEAYAR